VKRTPAQHGRRIQLAALPVTAIVPCFNAAPWLRQCLESVLDQSRPVAEVVVVDDGSTDASAAIAAEYPVRVVRLGVNRGAAAARNGGIRAASHDILAWIDADDYWDDSHCAEVVPLLLSQPTAAVAFSRTRYLDERGREPWGEAAACESQVRFFPESFERCVVPMISAITRREACLAIGGFREELRAAVDFDFWLRLSYRYPFVWTAQVTASYRGRHAPGQLTADRPRARMSHWLARMDMWRELEQLADPAAAEVEEILREIWVAELAMLWRRRAWLEMQATLRAVQDARLETDYTARLRRFLDASVCPS
jgi:GT2 family glycosyltransferase